MDGATPITNVTVSDTGLLDATYAIGQNMIEDGCIWTGSYSSSGCPYASFMDYLNAPFPAQAGVAGIAPSPGPGCLTNGDCVRNCVVGCNGLTYWFGIAGEAAATNSIADLAGNSWQRTFNSMLLGSSIINQELGSQMVQFGVNYAIANGSNTGSIPSTVSGSVVSLKPVAITSITASGGSTSSATGCINPTGSAGTCTINWATPPGLCTVGTNCPPNGAPNGTQYRLKYWYCNGSLTILGNDCPTGGKAIQPSLGFRDDGTTAQLGTPQTLDITQTYVGVTSTIGSAVFDPAHNANWFTAIDVPDCGNGTSTTACNSAAVTGTSYTFVTQPGTTYNFDLRAYATAASVPFYFVDNDPLGCGGSGCSDSNAGTSKTTAWVHLPNMLSSTVAHTPVPGDVYIIKGCDVYPNASFPISWTQSGTSVNPITIDRDTTWYNTTNCPSAWNRVIFDAGGTAIQAPECTGGNKNFYIVATNALYVNFNWIEAKNYFWNSDQGSSCFGKGGFFQGINSDFITLNSWYFHAWNVGGSATDNDHMIAAANSTTNCLNCRVQNSVFDNSDGNGDSGVGLQFNALNNVIHDVVNAIKPIYQGEFGGNNIYNIRDSFDGTTHPNCIESVGALGPTHTYFIHDNLIHDAVTCEGLQIGNANEIDYVWNNIWFNMTHAGANGPNLPQGGSPSVSLFYWNNTNVDQRTVCAAVGSNGNKWSGSFLMQNNLCITATTPTGTVQSGGMVDQNITGASTINFSNNLVESLATANGQGYTNAQPIVYSPTGSGSPTVGAGTNLTSSWPAGFPTSDTSYSCLEQTVSGVVQAVCPQRTPNPRPLTSPPNWDIGYVQLLGGGSVTVAPSSIMFPSSPVGVCAGSCTPQGVTITNGSSSTITFGMATITGAGAASFSIVSTCTGTLAPSATCTTLSTTFTPATVGTQTATLSQPYTGGGGGTLTVSLSGVGVGLPGPPSPVQVISIQ